MWENDPSLVPKTKDGEDLKQDMLFKFVLSNDLFKPSEWLNQSQLGDYENWKKAYSAS